jgi:hypothetical protein
MTMWKEVLFVAGAAAVGEYAARKWGAGIEKKAIEMKVPPMLANALVVGAFAAAGYGVAKAIL